MNTTTSSDQTLVKQHIEFVSDFLQRYAKHTNLIGADNQVSPAELNYALAEYYAIGAALNTQYQIAKAEMSDLEIDYQIWYDKAFEKAKESVINEYGDIKVKPSLKEFEVRIRTSNSQDYYKWERKKTNANLRVRFIVRHLDLYKRFDNVLMTLAHNMRQELRSLSIESRASSDPEKVRRAKIRNDDSLTTRRL